MKTLSTKQRRGSAAHRLGHRAERLCRFILRLKLYRIVASRYKTKQGEIDIIAARGRTLAFIEVKARPDHATASQAVLPHQQERLSRAAMSFLANHPHYARHYLRFDFMLVAPWRWPVHKVNAFASK